MVQSAAAVGRGEEPTRPTTLSSSSSLPLRDRFSSYATTPTLTGTNSMPSSEAISLQSHVSVPVTGTFPLGSLRAHSIMNSPPPRPVGPLIPEKQQKVDGDSDDEMPSLEDQNHTIAASAGDVFLLLDLPPNSTVGCDTKAIGTGPATTENGGGFQGVRDIPPGTHFIWVSVPNAMLRCGYWFVTDSRGKGRQVHVKQWDKFNEALIDAPSQFEMCNLMENVCSLFSQLVPYGLVVPPRENDSATAVAAATPTKPSETELWEQLTCCITEKVLSRVTGKKVHLTVSEWLIDTADTAAGESGGVLGLTSAPYQKQSTRGAAGAAGATTSTSTITTSTHKAVYQSLVGSTGELNFVFPEGDVDLYELIDFTNNESRHGSGGATTSSSVAIPDTSLEILRLVDTPGTGITSEDLVGELQLTFLTGLHLSNLSCVDQWWHLVLKVFLRAHELLFRRPSLSLLFLRTLCAQVVYNEEYIAGAPGNHSSLSSHDSHRTHNDSEVEVVVMNVRHEYGGDGASDGTSGGSNNTTSLLDIVPGNKKKLRAALTLYKRRMNEILLDFAPRRIPGQRGSMTPEQSAVEQVFAEMEAWFWRWGWDLRTDYQGSKPLKATSGGVDGDDQQEQEEGYDDDDDDDEDEDDDEYKPMVVNLDENGREMGMISFH